MPEPILAVLIFYPAIGQPSSDSGGLANSSLADCAENIRTIPYNFLPHETPLEVKHTKRE
jgi:hypothetical protein